MSFAYWDGTNLTLGFKAGTTWKYKRVPAEIKALETVEPERAFELAKKLAAEIDRQQGAAAESFGGLDVTLRMFLKKFIDETMLYVAQMRPHPEPILEARGATMIPIRRSSRCSVPGVSARPRRSRAVAKAWRDRKRKRTSTFRYSSVKSRSGRDSKARRPLPNDAAEQGSSSLYEGPDGVGCDGEVGDRNGPLQPDPVGAALGRALQTWCEGRDLRSLRRALLGVLAELENE